MSKLSATATAISGSVASSAAMAITYPLITLTTRQQVFANSQEVTSSLRTLYAGVQSSVCATFVSQGIYFFFFDSLSKLAHTFKEELGALDNLGLAALAGAVNVMITNPVWVVVTHQQTAKGAPEAFTQTLSKMLKSEGIWSLWKGVQPSLVLVLNPAIVFMIFETLIARARKRAKLNPALRVRSREIFLLGALAKLIATIVTFPILTIKSRMQAAPKNQELPTNPQPQGHQNTATIWGTVKQVAQENGGGPEGAVKGLYKGLRAKVLQTVLNTALMFVLKDKIDPIAAVLAGDHKG